MLAAEGTDFHRPVIGLDERRWRARTRRAEYRAIAEGAGGADHGERKNRGNGDDADAAARRQRIVIEIRVRVGLGLLVKTFARIPLALSRRAGIGRRRLVAGAIESGSAVKGKAVIARLLVIRRAEALPRLCCIEPAA